MKKITIFLLTVLLLVGFASATSISVSTPAPFTKSNYQTSFIITNTGSDATTVEITLPSTISDSSGHVISISSSSSLTYTNLTPGQSTGQINLAYSGDNSNFDFGTSSSNIAIKAYPTANPANYVTQTLTLQFQNTFCKNGEQNVSSVTLSSVSINNDDGDDTEWKPLDNIKVKVELENNGDNKVSSVYAEIGLINQNGKNIINNMENLDNKKISAGSLDTDKTKTIEFNFQVPADFNEENYYFVVKAYKNSKESEICSSSSSDLSETYYESIDGARQTDEKKQVVVTNIQTSPEDVVRCGEKVQISADVVNIGDQDFNDQIKVNLYNKDLKLDIDQVLKGDLNEGDTTPVDFEFDVPADVVEKTYNLEFITYYDYKSGDNYGITSQDKFIKTIKVSGDCVAPQSNKPQLQISAELDPETPEAIAGNQVIIQSTIKNTGSAQATYSLSVYGNSGWSSLVSLDPQSITLNSGEQKTVSIVLNIDKEASGDKEFTIKATSGSASTEQKVSLSVSQEKSSFSGIANNLSKNWFIYMIILVNLILIIAIILVIKRMVSGRKREFE